ncbi:DsbA family protein [Candidatus Parcubacteria bacterium]|nr:DsbA family protein [Candidatus Parcubacteria bacterium]
MEPTYQTPQGPKNNILIPVAIIIAGAFIAGSLIYIKRSDVATNQPPTEHLAIAVNAITEGDHTLGNPNASVMMLEYSDTECPFCQRFHPTLQKLMDTHGKDGKLGWTYRHFTVHKDFAPKEAEALECVAELGGNAQFWKYLETLFSKRKFPVAQGDAYVNVEPTELPIIAETVGVNRSAFNQCLTSGKYAEKIRLQYNDAISAGAVGTPHTVLFSQKPITRETKDFIDTVNLQLLARMGRGSSAPFAISQDNKKVLVSGAMDFAIMNQLVQMLVRANS